MGPQSVFVFHGGDFHRVEPARRGGIVEGWCVAPAGQNRPTRQRSPLAIRSTRDSLLTFDVESANRKATCLLTDYATHTGGKALSDSISSLPSQATTRSRCWEQRVQHHHVPFLLCFAPISTAQTPRGRRKVDRRQSGFLLRPGWRRTAGVERMNRTKFHVLRIILTSPLTIEIFIFA